VHRGVVGNLTCKKDSSKLRLISVSTLMLVGLHDECNVTLLISDGHKKKSYLHLQFVVFRHITAKFTSNKAMTISHSNDIGLLNRNCVLRVTWLLYKSETVEVVDMTASLQQISAWVKSLSFSLRRLTQLPTIKSHL